MKALKAIMSFLLAFIVSAGSFLGTEYALDQDWWDVFNASEEVPNENPTENPNENPDARLIPVVREINDDIIALCGGAGTDRGTGGMITKIHAAQIASSADIPTAIMNGTAPQDIYKLIDGHSVGTIFTVCRKAE
jgi:hypothetical protein